MDLLLQANRPPSNDAPAKSSPAILVKARSHIHVLLLLRSLASLLRILLHGALRLLLRLLRFLGHCALLCSEMASFAACTRESRCTSSRIHQHIEKNSVPLKEVLTHRSANARSVIPDNNAMRRNRD